MYTTRTMDKAQFDRAFEFIRFTRPELFKKALEEARANITAEQREQFESIASKIKRTTYAMDYAAFDTPVSEQILKTIKDLGL